MSETNINSELQTDSYGECASVARPEERTGQEQFVSYLRMLWKRRSLLIRVGVAGLICSVVVTMMIHERFEATTRLMPPDEHSNSGLSMLAASVAGQAGGLGPLASDLMGVKSSGALFVGVLGSRTIQDRLIERFELKQVYHVGFSTDARAILAMNTSIAEDRKSGIITVTVTDQERKRAAALAGAYVEELDHVVSQLSTSSAHRERVFLEERLKSVKQDLDAAADRLGEFSSKNSTLDIQSQGKAMVDAASRIQGEMIAAQAQLQGLRQIYTESNVRVREAEARIAELERQLQKLGGTDPLPAKNGSAAIGDPLYPSIKQLPLLGVKYADLYRKTKIEEIVYETLTQQYELAKVQEAKETPSVKVLDAAIPPERKSYPPRTLIVGLGTMIFGVFGAGWIVLTAFWASADPLSPNKLFVREVARDLRGHVAAFSDQSGILGGVFRKVSHSSNDTRSAVKN